MAVSNGLAHLFKIWIYATSILAFVQRSPKKPNCNCCLPYASKDMQSLLNNILLYLTPTVATTKYQMHSCYSKPPASSFRPCTFTLQPSRTNRELKSFYRFKCLKDNGWLMNVVKSSFCWQNDFNLKQLPVTGC